MPWTPRVASPALAMLVLPLPAWQDPAAEAQRQRVTALAAGIRAFCADWSQDRLGLLGQVRGQPGLQPAYVPLFREAGVVENRDLDRLTHLDVLQKALFEAERRPDAEVADALLDLASIGYDRSLVDRDARMLRDLGHWSLMRTDHQGTWFLLLRAAAGEQLPFLAEARQPASPDVARQVAAIRCIGMKGRPVFRSTLEAQLVAFDPRVRLAAVEVMEFQRRADSLPVLARALGAERHPVVAQALVRAVLATLQLHGEAVGRDGRERAVRAALRTLGQAGWRADMELIDLAERYPAKAAIPELIGVLERTTVQPDKLVQLVNKDAAPRLRFRAWEVLRGLTGALLPPDQPAEWRGFWALEQDNIQVPEKIGRFRENQTRAEFFGIPVTGREVAFVVDISGSMSDPAGSGPVTGPGRMRGEGTGSRLDAARQQLLQAVGAMDPESMRFHLVAFANHAAAWSQEPVKPDQQSLQALARVVGRMQAEGGTNVYEALVQTLALEKLRYGQEAPTGIDELFLLSDGLPTVGMKDPDEILQAVSTANQYLRVRIHTVFTGNGPGADFLKKLAEQNGGVFVQR